MGIAGEMVPSLVQVCQELCKKCSKEKGTPVSHVQVDCAIHGMLHSGMLSHKKFVEFLQSNDSILNAHNPCVANKTVWGKQLTVTWHVDNVKVSSQDKLTVDKFIQFIRNEHETFTQVKPSRGKVHDHLAMILDCNNTRKVKMEKCIEAMNNEFPFPESINNGQ